MDKIWKFDGYDQDANTRRKKICFKSRLSNIILDSKNNTFSLKNEGMKLGLGGIGQGFIADKIKALVEKGVVAESKYSGDINT
jgi:thiamine biosynthesis lipoprotein